MKTLLFDLPGHWTLGDLPGHWNLVAALGVPRVGRVRVGPSLSRADGLDKLLNPRFQVLRNSVHSQKLMSTLLPEEAAVRYVLHISWSSLLSQTGVCFCNRVIFRHSSDNLN